MKVLFIGGTGNISTSASRLAVEKGMELYLLNRGNKDLGIDGVHSIVADINSEPEKVKEAIKDLSFDCVVNWIAFTPDQIERDIELFTGKTRQYIFISSASAYQKPLAHPIVTESTPLWNPHWQYSRNKIACEDRLNQEMRENNFPATIVRPSLTYGDQLIPLAVGSWNKPYTVVDRMKKGKRVIVHGDGTSIWTVTHSDDFAKGIVGLLGNSLAVGHSFHITSDEILSWNQIYREVAYAVGVEPNLVHIPSEMLMAMNPGEEGNLLGDKAESVICDNSKLKQFVPDFKATITWKEGVRRALAWFEADESRQQIDDAANKQWDTMLEIYDEMIEKFKSAGQK